MRSRRHQTYLAILAVALALATTSAFAQWVNGAVLTASDRSVDFGRSVAVYGNTMVVGARFNDPAGAAYVFIESSGVWSQVARLTPSNSPEGAGFGESVAISGNTIVVGTHAVINSQAVAIAYVFVMPATGWIDMTETAQLTPSDATASSGFGQAVAISGNTIAVSAPQQTLGNKQQGVIYVFVEPPTGWQNMTQTAELTASDGAAGLALGYSLAMQGDTVVAGEIGYHASFGEQGAAYVFEKPATGWANEQESAKLTATDPHQDDMLGSSVAISADEGTIVAGAPRHQVNDSGPTGVVYLYSKPTSGWQSATQSSELLAPPPASWFGFDHSLAINRPGTIIAVGAPYITTNVGIDVGGAYIYRKPSTGWPALPHANAKLNPPTPQHNGFFGEGIAVRATTVLVGEFGADVGANASQGAVYVFDRQ